MSTVSSFAAVQRYLRRLPDGPASTSSIWRGDDGSVQGRFFACTLTSAFHAIHVLGAGHAAPAGYEGVARGVAPADRDLSVWRLLDRGASDDESVELDRLGRVLHAINYFRQPAAAAGTDLYLSVHDRLLAAVSSNHGHAFLRILNVLELPASQVVLQLPAIGPASRWLANYVADNYRRNGFRLALTAATIDDAFELVSQFQPHAVTLAAPVVTDPAALAQLLDLARAAHVNVIVKRVDTAGALALLETVARATGTVVLAQGDALAPAVASITPPETAPAAPGRYSRR